ncbi:hypothetical protein LTR37_004728 [Vermiconidia calcicola]|uniref:Uncharacterized protein n=1 Tax=Vermiconidia calcicola TaxID=1690605 RepID=A0ACC3NLI4_9PEZI|nr:hypothetical protein LTR37_004728 [Vermiconidia calcicola]
MSLVAQNTFDVEFGTLYALCCAIENCMFLSHGIWLLRTRKLRREAKDAELSFDTFPPAQEWQNRGFKLGFAGKITDMIPRKMSKSDQDVESGSPNGENREGQLETLP